MSNLLPTDDCGWPVDMRYAVVEVTNRCNMRCPHCASTSGKTRDGELTHDEFKSVFNSLANLGCKDVALIGGEIFLRKEWKELCLDVIKTGMRLSVITNGLLLKKEERDFFNEIKPHVIGVSLDGPNREIYKSIRGIDAFDKVWSLLKALKEEDGHKYVSAITTIMKDNLVVFDEFAELLDNTDITWQIQMAHQGGERFFDRDLFLSEEDWLLMASKVRTYFRTKRDTLKIRMMDDFGFFPIDPTFRFLHQTWKGCAAGRGVIGIRSNGNVLGCLSLGDSFVEANLKKEALEDIWLSGKYFKRFREKRKLLTGHCAKCSFADKCMGGATCMALSATGDIGNNPYCLRYQEEKELLKNFASL